MIREQLRSALTDAMRARDRKRVDALRLIQAAIKNRDIEMRTARQAPDDDQLVTEVLLKMAKQHHESIAMFEQGGRAELAAAERAELEVIESFLPQQMSDADTDAAVAATIAAAGAQSLKDMGKVMAQLKQAHGAALDMTRAAATAKRLLGGN